MEHPSVYIREEMDARDWGTPTMARQMGGDYGVNRLAIEMYLSIGPQNPGLRLGTMAADIARAFDVSVELFQNLEAAWLASLSPSDGADSTTGKGQDTQTGGALER